MVKRNPASVCLVEGAGLRQCKETMMTGTGTSEMLNHDALFKWLITLFTGEFFSHYFPKRDITEVTFVDKEFVKKFDLGKSLEGDLLLLMKMRIDGKLQSVLVYIEHKGQRMDPGEQIMEYTAYAYLYKKLPVWSIAFFTDDAQWRKEVSDRYWFAFTEKEGKQDFVYDKIKLNREKSATLLAEKSLFTSLLALKADGRGVAREDMIRSIYQIAVEMGDRLTNKHILLINLFIEAYGKVAPEVLDHIKEEQKVTFVATTVEEHYIHIGEVRGREEGREVGREEGREVGREEGIMQTLNALLQDGLISKEVYRRRIALLGNTSDAPEN